MEKDGGERTKGTARPSSNVRCSGASVTTKESKISLVVEVVASGGGAKVKSTALGGMVNLEALLKMDSANSEVLF